MVAWANREALELALDTGFMHYWSRSRGRLWKKGESSGNLQRLVSLHADCDADTVLARVRMDGPACHTDEPTCFGAGACAASGADPDAGISGEPARATPGTLLDELWAVMETRDRDRPEGSYTTKLLEDENLRLKKLGEEVTELVTALVRGDGRAPEEAADLLYHLFAALKGGGHGLDEVAAELERRRG
ncbi:MAG: phosphoribosyl-ATP diphosphatase [Gemmatimonadales bacterium]|nr:MAG: phosphoribosyl-ATP diphosphatase [Gemmatimonadales bacterium]